MLDQYLINNLWVVICALLVYAMTISVGFLEVGQLGEHFDASLLKTTMIVGSAIFLMAFVGFNTAFAPTLGGIIGNPFYNGLFLGGFSADVPGLLSGNWWSMGPAYFGTGLTVGTYFFFEAAFAAVTLALVGVVVLKKMKMRAFFLYSIPYFIIIWSLPAAWIWNPTGWLFEMGMRDFAGGVVVHAAAGAAGLGMIVQIWREERRRGHTQSPPVAINVSPGWLTLSILLLSMGWFGFNSGSVLAFNESALVVILTTFLAAASAFMSVMFFQYVTKRSPGLLAGVNGTLTGLIIITPIAGFVSPASAVILGLLGGPLYIAGEKLFTMKWYSDPVGLFPGHLLGGVFGTAMIGFFTQHAFAVASGNSNLPDGLLFGGGYDALHQLGIELFGVVVVCAVVFLLSYIACWGISAALHGIIAPEQPESIPLE